ncbi:competence protein ComK [Bacillus aquiflavi]|nr:competence protein ComK [Bacillus aquiflavi]UAC47885.1 competence protein ComK [Bacillus aquiflavi]
MVVKENYLISTSTMGLKEALHPEYETIIYDQKGTYYSKKKAVDLLNEACILKDGAD